MKEIMLQERIGIDRTVLYDFEVLEVDERKLEKAIGEENRIIQLEFNEESPIRVHVDGELRGLDTLFIQDDMIGQLSVKLSRNMKNRTAVIANLKLTVSYGTNNLQNLNTKEYKDRIDNVFEYLATEYGVKADYEKLRIKSLELNATLYLEEPFNNYRDVIELFIRNVPKEHYSGKTGGIKVGSWGEVTKEDKFYCETSYVNNQLIKLKIYNKGKHLEDISSLSYGDNILRIEYTFLKAESVRRQYGDNTLASLSDEVNREIFKNLFKRDIIDRFYEWKCKNQEELFLLVKKHMNEDRYWVRAFLLECAELEKKEDRSLPVLFDVEDVLEVLKKIEKGNNKIAYNKFRALKKKASTNRRIRGNNKRAKEIMNKIMKM